MLSGFPVYHYFKNGNSYFGAEGGMRYLIAPDQCADPADPEGEKKRACLTATVWPGPWSLEHTALEKRQSQRFSGDQAGLDAAAAWLAERYDAERERWDNIPSILDCDPDQ